MPRIVHFEIPSDNPERTIKFYGDIFGWKFEKFPGPMEYWLITTGPDGEPGINGGMMRRQQSHGVTVNTVGVDSVDKYVAAVEKNGGKVLVPKTAIPGVGYFANCTDPEGTVFGVYQHDPSAK